MTVAARPHQIITTAVREAIVDELRACQTKEQLLAFDKRFSNQGNIGPLYLVICDFLQDRTISRVLAAKCLRTLFSERERQLAIHPHL